MQPNPVAPVARFAGRCKPPFVRAKLRDRSAGRRSNLVGWRKDHSRKVIARPVVGRDGEIGGHRVQIGALLHDIQLAFFLRRG